MHLQLGNNRNGLEDSQAAVSRDSTATKVLVKSYDTGVTMLRVVFRAGLQTCVMSLQAYYRGARAALRLRHWDTAQQLCTAALGAAPDAHELAALLKVRPTGCSTVILCVPMPSSTCGLNPNTTALQEAEEGAAQDAERQQREREAATAARAPARGLAELLTSRGWRIGLPQVTIGLPLTGDRALLTKNCDCIVAKSGTDVALAAAQARASRCWMPKATCSGQCSSSTRRAWRRMLWRRSTSCMRSRTTWMSCLGQRCGAVLPVNFDMVRKVWHWLVPSL